MGHYAKVVNGIVTQVIVADEDFFTTFVDTSPGEWLRTSYNTRGNVHYGPDGKPDDLPPFRKNYAAIGYSYNHILDAFIPPQPYPSWILDDYTGLWNAPVPYPDDGKYYEWDEQTQSWKEDTDGPN